MNTSAFGSIFIKLFLRKNIEMGHRRRGHLKFHQKQFAWQVTTGAKRCK